MHAKKEKIYSSYVSKHNWNCYQKVILLMIANGKEWHYLAVKKKLALLRGLTSKNTGDFYCLDFLHSFGTKSKFYSHKRVCENKDFCNVIMLSKDTEILAFNQNKNSDKVLFIIYADLECITDKIDGCKYNPENSSRTKISDNIPSDF